ncbi:hypothetical protein AVEN_239254-1 [Araneus ventricosus]|uniref:Uncharacterized protein n=1 Tax=Araneus ventricosus TaxID=182803 RepID=A0A4Y2UW48_ARAVE|nr:hypothetical protein AVEN_239254-1 [Araneus ventricosus]
MDIPKIAARMAFIPCAWILMKLVMFGDLYNLLPMTILGYLIYLLDSAIRKQNLDKMITKQDHLLKKNLSSQAVRCEFAEKSIEAKQENVDAFTQTERGQIQEVSTQTAQAKIDAFTQTENKEFEKQHKLSAQLWKRNKFKLSGTSRRKRNSSFALLSFGRKKFRPSPNHRNIEYLLKNEVQNQQFHQQINSLIITEINIHRDT